METKVALLGLFDGGEDLLGEFVNRTRALEAATQHIDCYDSFVLEYRSGTEAARQAFDFYVGGSFEREEVFFLERRC
jgi:hypothetical protein